MIYIDLNHRFKSFDLNHIHPAADKIITNAVMWTEISDFSKPCFITCLCYVIFCVVIFCW